MSKTMVVTDRQYDWFCARSRKGPTMAQVIDHIIGLVEHYEADLEKYRKWAEESFPKPKTGDML